MRLFARSLWPEGFRRPWLQLGFALVAAPVVLAGAVALAAFAVYWASEPAGATAAQLTGRVAVGLLVYLGKFTPTGGLAGIAFLWALGLRGVLSWLAIGTGAGAFFVVGDAALWGKEVTSVNLAVAAVTGLVLFALIRWFAGVRGG